LDPYLFTTYLLVIDDDDDDDDVIDVVCKPSSVDVVEYLFVIKA